MTSDCLTDLLIIGAGPFGLSLAAYAEHIGLEHLVVGEPMSFWHSHMPRGMLLRSGLDWHLDPMDVHTIEAYVRSMGEGAGIEPLSLDFYLGYAEWFRAQRQIEVLPLPVE